jgi:hypothetical protein
MVSERPSNFSPKGRGHGVGLWIDCNSLEVQLKHVAGTSDESKDKRSSDKSAIERQSKRGNWKYE